jgi:Ni/Fe-hydrogenase subunit HybB-like protein
MEIVLSLALVSFGAAVFIVVVKYLPVFPKEAEEQRSGGAELLPEPARG